MNIQLREWHTNDLAALVHHANNPNIARNMMDRFPYPYTTDDGKRFIERATTDEDCLIRAIDWNGEAIGSIGLFPQADIERKNAELGYWLSEDHWGKGIMQGAVRQMVKTGFAQLPIDRIFARPFGHNTASQKLLEKCGFILEAKIVDGFFKQGVYIDALIYAVRRAGFPGH